MGGHQEKHALKFLFTRGEAAEMVKQATVALHTSAMSIFI
jgi:hypothetical protein